MAATEGMVMLLPETGYGYYLTAGHGCSLRTGYGCYIRDNYGCYRLDGDAST
jgi:hypothetical protein